MSVCWYPDEPDHDHAYWCPPEPRPHSRVHDLVRIGAGVALVLLVAAMGALLWRTGAAS